jgi:uncharacterized protein
MSEKDFTSASFREYLRQHRLMGARCKSCGEIYLPPRSMCRACHTNDLEWVELGSSGRLAAFTTIYIALTAMIEAGYSRAQPYCSGIVKLDDGPSISAQILGVDVGGPDQTRIGTPLEVEFIDRKEGEETRTYLAFRAVKSM